MSLFTETTFWLLLATAPAFGHTSHHHSPPAPTAPTVLPDAAVPAIEQLLYQTDPATSFFSTISLITTAGGCGVISTHDADLLVEQGTELYVAHTAVDDTFYSDLTDAAASGAATSQQPGACQFFSLNPSIAEGLQMEAQSAESTVVLP
jgi:hypothetical protein